MREHDAARLRRRPRRENDFHRIAASGCRKRNQHARAFRSRPRKSPRDKALCARRQPAKGRVLTTARRTPACLATRRANSRSAATRPSARPPRRGRYIRETPRPIRRNSRPTAEHGPPSRSRDFPVPRRIASPHSAGRPGPPHHAISAAPDDRRLFRRARIRAEIFEQGLARHGSPEFRSSAHGQSLGRLWAGARICGL